MKNLILTIFSLAIGTNVFAYSLDDIIKVKNNQNCESCDFGYSCEREHLFLPIVNI